MVNGQPRCDACPMPKLLPACWPGIVAYRAVSTQWRSGFAGRTGLDYTACIALLDRQLPRWQTQPGMAETFAPLSVAELMEDVMVIESATLTADHEQREAARDEAEAKRRG